MKLPAVLGALALLLGACGQPAAKAPGAPEAPTVVASDGRPTSHALLGQPAPEFSAPLTDGGEFASASFRGRWTILEFWGIWCSDCMRDAPHVQALARAVAQDPGLRFVSIHVDDRYARWPSVAAYAAEAGIDYPIALDPDRAIYEKFKIEWVPTFLLIGPDGVVRDHRTDLSVDPAPEGGVKAYLKRVAAVRAAHPG